MVRQPRLHRGRDAQRHVDAAEVVPCHVEGNGGFQVLQLLAEGVYESRESP